MNKKLVFSVMLVCVLVLGFVMVGCPQPSGGGGGSNDDTNGTTTGNFRIRVTDIPFNPRNDTSSVRFGLFKDKDLNLQDPTDESKVVGGRDPINLLGDDDAGSNYFEFSVYADNRGTKYTGAAGKYDFGFYGALTNGTIFARYKQSWDLKIGTNTISWNDLTVFQ